MYDLIIFLCDFMQQKRGILIPYIPLKSYSFTTFLEQ